MGDFTWVTATSVKKTITPKHGTQEAVQGADSKTLKQWNSTMAKKSKNPKKGKSAAIVRPWRPFFMLGCSHAEHINQEAWDWAMKIRHSLKNPFVVHLGDYTDTTAFMGNAGHNALGSPIGPDIEKGLAHLTEMEPSAVINGNHDQRPYDFLDHPDAKIAYAAKQVVAMMENHIAGLGVKAENHIMYEGIQSILRLGPAALTHGTIYGQNAVVKMAEMYGTEFVRFVFFVHTHVCKIATSATYFPCTAFNIGSMIMPKEAKYAGRRPNTFAWQNACVSGEYCEDRLEPVLHLFDRKVEPMQRAVGQ